MSPSQVYIRNDSRGAMPDRAREGNATEGGGRCHREAERHRERGECEL
jgi:hypothetical protein